MSTFFLGEGNLGSNAEYQMVPMGNDEPRHVLRMNIYFDNPVPHANGYMDRGGYWAPVDLWHKEAQNWAGFYQNGMRVLVEGRIERDEWTDREGNERVTFKINAKRVAILPHRLEAVTMRERTSSSQRADAAEPAEETETEESAEVTDISASSLHGQSRLRQAQA